MGSAAGFSRVELDALVVEPRWTIAMVAIGMR